MKNKYKSYLDFGNQFKIYSDFNGIFGNKKTVEYYIKPFDLMRVKNKIVLDIGAGAGRISKNILKFKPKKIFCLEPSKAIQVAKKNIKEKNCIFLNYTGEKINFINKFDFIFSIGVLHHTPNIKQIIRKALKALKKKGELIFWIYGYDDIKSYVYAINKIRNFTIFFPDKILIFFSNLLNILCYFYSVLCYVFNLPLKNYFIKIFSKFSYSKRNLIIFDQLNPAYTKYYSYNDVFDLMKSLKIKNYKIINKDNYSWTVIIKK